jgi:hypothetical protein
MGEVRPLPSPGEVFTDVRGDERTMRVSYHSDRDVVVVSLWYEGLCRASFRLAAGDVDRFTDALRTLRSAPALRAAPAPPDVVPASDAAPVASLGVRDPDDVTGASAVLVPLVA